MAAAAQLALPFEQPEHFLYHNPSRSGFVSLLGRTPEGKMAQNTFHLKDMPIELAAHAGQADRWISQGEFFRANRRVVNLSRMPVAYVDLDTYKNPRLAGLAPEVVVDLLLRACNDDHMPEPSIVVDSGRGLQAKWLLAEPVPHAALPRWTAVQRQLNAALKDFGPDPFAMDAARVLRLEGSVNSKSGRVVRVLHYCDRPALGGELLASGVVGYDFGELADTVLPLSRQELAERRAARAAVRANLVAIQGGLAQEARAGGARPLVPSELAWARVSDLRTLARIRGFEGGLPSGQRNDFVFLGAVFLAHARLVCDLEAEIETLAAEFAPTWSPAEVASCVSSAVSRAKAAARGEKVEFRGQMRDPRYLYTNDKLVEMLEITSNEGHQLKTILPAVESRRRDAVRHEKKRRADNVPRRTDLNAETEAKRLLVRGLFEQGKSKSEIARVTEIPRSTVIRLLKP